VPPEHPVPPPDSLIATSRAMGKVAQVVMGPAGSGKTTYCATMHQHCATTQRVVHIVNLDPVRTGAGTRKAAHTEPRTSAQAAENLSYEPSIDIRDLISLADVMDVRSACAPAPDAPVPRASAVPRRCRS
jgi:hypothetical protein